MKAIPQSGGALGQRSHPNLCPCGFRISLQPWREQPFPEANLQPRSSDLSVSQLAKGPGGTSLPLNLFLVHPLRKHGGPFLKQRSSDFRVFSSDFVSDFQHVPSLIWDLEYLSQLCILCPSREVQESVHLFIPISQTYLTYSLHKQIKDTLSICLTSKFSVLNYLLISNLLYILQMADYTTVEI